MWPPKAAVAQGPWDPCPNRARHGFCHEANGLFISEPILMDLEEFFNTKDTTGLSGDQGADMVRERWPQLPNLLLQKVFI